MALVKCKECGAKVSNTAKACPKCDPPDFFYQLAGKQVNGGHHRTPRNASQNRHAHITARMAISLM